MSHPLPPLNPLRAFEVAARLRSLTRAADELHVSQVAVSRQVKVLEDYLGVTLFTRLHRGIELTQEGAELYDGIKNAFRDIEKASRKVSRRNQRDTLSIQSYTTFSQRWLIPRLADFHKKNPLLEVKLSSSLKPVDFSSQNVDAAIRSGHGDWPGLHAEKLVDIELIPIVSASLWATENLAKGDISRVRLLHSMARPDDWKKWIEASGSQADPEMGIKFDNSALAYEAASMDIGCAIAIKVFIERQLQDGGFVALSDFVCKTGEAYYLTWPKDARPSDALLKFLEWMRGLIEQPL
ncbi:LysR family transcriptional regulator [Billgrantia tianxiuensis]|jgi:LysR family glycine cleavage system transcriptional activator|uniref:LysR family transcriptional regulator n=1 Tax=Billgrantia tianxiuensis TaxID=2497861 RepID=A0A6I6SLJ4_9GAMM|nr:MULTISPECIES: LysR substrate-binding domain-containing protein [Halomonas]MCE8035499.1 LysR family transcriptional regulator [Halomonas sp. MCCC 1A11057]QHC51628.1 LysR family transcriptional regulator [Halomonas tianxiuensis]